MARQAIESSNLSSPTIFTTTASLSVLGDLVSDFRRCVALNQSQSMVPNRHPIGTHVEPSKTEVPI